MKVKKYKDVKIAGDSVNWKNWQCFFDDRLCDECFDMHGKIYELNSKLKKLHFFDRCLLVFMRTKKTGKATSKGLCGVDAYLKYTGKLPPEYITKSDAILKGWQKNKGNLSDVLPGKVIGGDVFYNSDEKLPEKEGRIWYEADLEYEEGYRTTNRILYSSDGLIFLTYDHYETFYELV